MPLSQVDASAALVVIDMQKGVLALPTVHSTADILGRVAELAKAFRARNLPVVLVDVAGRAPGRTDLASSFNPPADWRELPPELDVQPTDGRATKFNVGAFYGTSLEMVLRRQGVTQVILVGVSTSSGVEATARAAYDHGYNVVTVVDAMTDTDADNHRHSIEKIFPKIGQITTTEAVLNLLRQSRQD